MAALTKNMHTYHILRVVYAFHIDVHPLAPAHRASKRFTGEFGSLKKPHASHPEPVIPITDTPRSLRHTLKLPFPLKQAQNRKYSPARCHTHRTDNIAQQRSLCKSPPALRDPQWGGRPCLSHLSDGATTPNCQLKGDYRQQREQAPAVIKAKCQRTMAPRLCCRVWDL